MAQQLNTKICKTCKIEKVLVDFPIHKRMRDGLESSCKKCKSIRWNNYYINKKDELREKYKLYRDKNKNKIKKYMDQYRKDNASQIQKQHNEYCLNKIHTDINYKIGHYLRARTRLAIRNLQKVGSAVKDLGCSIDELRAYFVPLFYNHPDTSEQMTWENYGAWHIDHIIPLSKFDLTDREQFLKACNYTNLQPLWETDNCRKGNRV